jgi:hypothetical protein
MLELHVSTKYDYEWSKGFFANKSAGFEKLLRDIEGLKFFKYTREDQDGLWDGNGDGIHIPVDTEQLRLITEYSTELKKKPRAKNVYIHEFTNSQIARILTDIVDLRAKDKDYIILSWF